VTDLKKGARITGASREKLADQVTKKYEGGDSIRELAESTGRSYGFVHRLLSENGAAMRGRGGATRGKDSGVRKMASSAKSKKTTAKTATGRARLHSVK